MKAYTFYTKNLTKYSVRFYSTGGYTVVDGQGYEHEVGMWFTYPQTLDNGKPSKDKHCVTYTYREFNSKCNKKSFHFLEMSSMARSVICDYWHNERNN